MANRNPSSTPPHGGAGSATYTKEVQGQMVKSEVDGLLSATVISVSGKCGFMKHTHVLPPPYNHNKIVQFVKPESLTKGQKVVFTLDKDSQKKLIAMDVAFAHISYDPKTTIPCVGEMCGHICFRNKAKPESEMLCEKDCVRKLTCTHACPKKCFEECPAVCKQCRKKKTSGKENVEGEKKDGFIQGQKYVEMKKEECEGTYTVKDLKEEMQGQVVHLTEQYGFIQPTRNVPGTFKRTSIYFNLSHVKEPDTITLRSFVSFKMNVKYPDRPYAVLVKKIPKDSVQGFSEQPYTLSDLDGLLYATIVSVNGKYGFMKPMQELPSPYNRNKIVQFVTPDGILDKSYTRGQQVVFILDKDSQKKLIAKDVAFIHASYDPTTTVPYVGDLCDHICFRNKGDAESVISCQKVCARKLICTHACPKMCFEKCPEECKKCRGKRMTVEKRMTRSQ